MRLFLRGIQHSACLLAILIMLISITIYYPVSSYLNTTQKLLVVLPYIMVMIICYMRSAMGRLVWVLQCGLFLVYFGIANFSNFSMPIHPIPDFYIMLFKSQRLLQISCGVLLCIYAVFGSIYSPSLVNTTNNN
ncbi:hypothetical protein BH10PSE19_BH10PSE19_01720 [soil metagenome]